MNVVTLSYQSINCYLIPANDGWLMIDSGLPDTFSQILQLLNQNHIAVNEINYLIITHYHPGHAGLTQRLRDLGTNLIVHEYQLPHINKLNLQFKKNPKANFRDIVSGNYIVLNDDNSPEFFESIGIHGLMISTPGHSDDSISLIIDGCCAFTGDLPSISLLDEYNDLAIDDSWDIIKQHEVKTIYPGHGDTYEL